jgi:hypothetical protein
MRYGATVERLMRMRPSRRECAPTRYSTNVAPRPYDLQPRHYVELLLRIGARGYSFEVANTRNEILSCGLTHEAHEPSPFRC